MEVERLPSDKAEKTDKADKAYPKNQPYPPYPKVKLALLGMPGSAYENGSLMSALQQPKFEPNRGLWLRFSRRSGDN